METIYDEIKDINSWIKYTPMEGQYYKYKSNIIYAACKIADLYYQVCNARMSLHFYMDYDKYSIMSDSKMAILSTKKYFVENALLYYNFAVDYLWQVLWLYYDNSENNFKIPINELYQKIMKECNFNDLIRGLTEIQENKIVEVLKDNFTNRNKLFKIIREYYNYLKHRAIFHTPSLGDNSNIGIIEWPTLIREKDSGTEMISYRIPLIARTELDMNELSDLLIKFDKNFVGICEYFFDIIIPRDYVTARKFKIESGRQYIIEHLKELDEYSKKHSEIISAMKCEMICASKFYVTNKTTYDDISCL